MYAVLMLVAVWCMGDYSIPLSLSSCATEGVPHRMDQPTTPSSCHLNRRRPPLTIPVGKVNYKITLSLCAWQVVHYLCI